MKRYIKSSKVVASKDYKVGDRIPITEFFRDTDSAIEEGNYLKRIQRSILNKDTNEYTNIPEDIVEEYDPTGRGSFSAYKKVVSQLKRHFNVSTEGAKYYLEDVFSWGFVPDGSAQFYIDENSTPNTEKWEVVIHN